MEETPDTPEALSQHFSRRASAARIATRRKERNAQSKPLPESPLTDNVHQLAVAPTPGAEVATVAGYIGRGTRPPAYHPAPDANSPTRAQKAETLREERRQRAGASKYLWKQLAPVTSLPGSG